MSDYLIWDFDGTLARRDGMWAGAVLDALATEDPEHGIAEERIRPFLRSGFPWHTPDEIRAPSGEPGAWWRALEPVFLQAFREGAGLDDTRAERLCPKVREAYLNPERWMLFDDVADTLTTLSHDGWRHVILSNHVPELRTLIEALGIDSHFEAVFNSAETGIEKPNPRAFRQGLDYLDESRPVWMIGDSMTADIEGAASAGLPSVLVRKQRPGATLYCETLAELISFLRTV